MASLSKCIEDKKSSNCIDDMSSANQTPVIDSVSYSESTSTRSAKSRKDPHMVLLSYPDKKQCPVTLEEIRKGEETEQYEEWLDQNLGAVDVISSEVDMCCFYDWPRRLNSILTVMSQHDQLWLPMNTVIMEAMSKRSHNVAFLLIQAVDKHWLTDICSSGKYAGGTVLHVVISQGAIDLVRTIMKRLQAEDRYRLIHTQVREPFLGKYLNGYGQNPVCLALLVGRFDIFVLLIKLAGDLDARDSVSGNSIMHNLVIFASKNPDKGFTIMKDLLEGDICKQWFCRTHRLTPTQFSKKERTAIKQDLLYHMNKHGLTPLTMATKYMIAPVVEYLLNCEGVYRHTQWTMGVSSSADYDVTEIDPVATHTKLSHQLNIMELVMYSKDNKFAPMNSEPLASIMQTKWHMYRKVFLIFALVHLVYMVVITGDILLFARLVDTQTREKLQNRNMSAVNVTNQSENFIIYQSQVSQYTRTLILLLSGFYLTWSLLDFAVLLYSTVENVCRFHKDKSLVHLLPTRKIDHFDVVLFLFSSSVIVAFALRRQGSDTSNFWDALSLLLGWYFCLFYARAFPHTCYITILVVRILFTDFPRLLFVILLVLLGFSSGLVLLFSAEAPEGFSDFGEILETMAFLGLGIGELDPSVLAGSGWSMVVIYFWILSYYLLTTILLLNILIATMTETYTSMSTCKHMLAMRMRVKSILTLERRIPSCFHRYLLRRAYREMENGRWVLTLEL